MAEAQQNTVERLEALLGFNPAKGSGVTKDALAGALEELRKERLDGARTKAKELLAKAIGLRQKFAEADKAFQKERQKFDGELGKILKQIENVGTGKPATDGDDEKELPESPTPETTTT